MVLCIIRWWRWRKQERREKEIHNKRGRTTTILADSRREGRRESYDDSSSLHYHIWYVHSFCNLGHCFCKWLDQGSHSMSIYVKQFIHSQTWPHTFFLTFLCTDIISSSIIWMNEKFGYILALSFDTTIMFLGTLLVVLTFNDCTLLAVDRCSNSFN